MLSVYTLMHIQVAFDLLTLLLAITNALDRPHHHRVEVIAGLKRDGALFFMVSTLLPVSLFPLTDEHLGVALCVLLMI